MSRVVVIGAGLGGLAVAARLAKHGHDVTVCEQAPVVGGKLGRFEKEGFRFDTGPSVLTLPPTLRDLFRKTGRPLEKVLDVVTTEPTCRYVFPDGCRLDLPNAGGLAAVQAALDATLGAGAGEQWGRLMARAAAMWDLTRESVLQSPLDGVASLLRLARGVGPVRTIAPWLSLQALGRHYLDDDRLRLLLARYATYTGSDPRHAPAVLATIPYVEQSFGSWHVRGGLYEIALAVADRARQRGATIRTETEVARIETNGTRVIGVRLANGETLAADVVVSDVDAAVLYGRLLPIPKQHRRLLRRTPSLSAFVIFLGVRGRTPGACQHTVLFPDDYDAEFDAIFGRHPRPVADPAIYVSVPDDPAFAPPGCESWFVLVNAPPHAPGLGVDWSVPELGSSYADRVLKLLALRGIDVRDRVVLREVRTPADLEQSTSSPGGSIYGAASHGWRSAFLRPANRSPVQGLFLVGGSAHPGGGLPLVLSSAAIVADLVGTA